jgi:hypothetical protein
MEIKTKFMMEQTISLEVWSSKPLNPMYKMRPFLSKRFQELLKKIRLISFTMKINKWQLKLEK